MKIKVTTDCFEVEIPRATSIIISDNNLFTVYSTNGSNVFDADSIQDFQFLTEEPLKTLSLLQVTRYIMKAEGLSISGAKAKAMEMMR
jgi:hypothetical protein